MPVVFFDIGDTLAEAQVDESTNRVQVLKPFLFVPGLLKALRDNADPSIRLGIISDTGDQTAADMEQLLRDCGMFDFFDPTLLIYSSEVGSTKAEKEIFERAAQAAINARLAGSPDECVYVVTVTQQTRQTDSRE